MKNEVKVKKSKDGYASPELIVSNIQLKQNILDGSGDTQDLPDFDPLFW